MIFTLKNVIYKLTLFAFEAFSRTNGHWQNKIGHTLLPSYYLTIIP